MAGLEPADPERLVWVAPEGASAAEFAALRPRLEKLVVTPRADEVYTAKRRSIYRSLVPGLGAVGIKELRNPGRLRQLWLRHVREHPALREFRVGARFRALGGRTPPLLAAASEQGVLLLRRVFVFVRWLDGAETLREHLARSGGEPPAELLARLAGDMAAAARLGLVHGRHSADNLLVVRDEGGLAFEPIDFAYARIADGFEAEGFVADVVRVAATLLLRGDCTREAAGRLFDEIARAGWTGAAEIERVRTLLGRELERFLARHRSPGG
jgi:tRNA A-37 threonylcarbamoyl transferase component Bud32